MKSFASSLHAFNQTYHSLQRSAGALLHHAGVILPALVGLYAVATNLLFIPLMQQLWSLTLRFAPVHYLNNSNASDIFVSPAIILCLVVIALLTAFWALYEFSVLLHGLELARSSRPVQLPALLRDALVDIRHTFRPQNWPVLVYSAVLIPFTSFFLTSNYVTQFAAPEYLLGVLRATTRYHALYLAIVVLLVLLFLSCALVLPLFVLERRSLWQAVRESVGFVRQRIFRTALLLLRWNLSAVLRSGSLALCVLAPLYAVILGIGLQNTAAMVALSRASLLVEVPFFQFLLDCSITIAQCSILFLLYRRLREGNAVPEDTQNGKPVRAKGRRLLAAAVVGVTLVTIGLSFVYIALPADDELRTMLGGAAPIVTAHRGYSTAAPENTLPAFQLAIGHHSDRAELDVQMTKDGVVMVTHDTSLRRCTGRNANIYDLTFAQVRELDAGRWFSAKYAGTKIPTLEEVLEADVVVQVLDAANPGCKQQRRDVLTVLAGLGLDKIEHQPNYLEVYNKIDLAPSFAAPSANAVKASALTGEGCKELLRKLDDVLAAGSAVIDVNIPSSDGKTISWLHRNGEVLSCLPGEEFLKMSVRLDAAAQSRLTALLKNAAD